MYQDGNYILSCVLDIQGYLMRVYDLSFYFIFGFFGNSGQQLDEVVELLKS